MSPRRAALVTLPLAWVVWMKSEAIFGTAEQQKPVWEVVESMTQEASCRALARRLESENRMHMTKRLSFQCLPDTVDPRPRQ